MTAAFIRGALTSLARWGGRQTDFFVSLSLAALTLVSRWPYRARMLYNWDAVQFALALREFDVAKHQPHPPGYLLYVGLGHLLNRWLADPAMAYVALAMLFSAGTTFVVYWLARALFDRATALAAAALLAVSPLFWFYGSVGLTYAGEAFGASVVAWYAWGALRGDRRMLLWGAAALGLVGGLRPSVLVLLLPLWAVAAWRGTRSFARLATAGAVLALSVLAWLGPMLWLTGGLVPYARASSQLYGSVLLPTSVIGGSLEIPLAQLRHLLESVLVGLGPLALALFALPGSLRRRGFGIEQRFLILWIATPVLFYTLVHFGQAGYVLTFLPALVILLAHALVESLAAGSMRLRRPHWRFAVTCAALVALVFLNTAFFVSARPIPLDFSKPEADGWGVKLRGEVHQWIMSRTAAALREHQAVIRTYVESIRLMCDPDTTVLITEMGNRRSYPWLRHAMFYLPEYPIYQLSLAPAPPGFYAPQSSATMILTPGTEITLSRRVTQLVWFVDHWDPAEPRPSGLREIALPYGRYLYVLPVGPASAAYASYTFRREPFRGRW